jgi:hypothetical protein
VLVLIIYQVLDDIINNYLYIGILYIKLIACEVLVDGLEPAHIIVRVWDYMHGERLSRAHVILLRRGHPLSSHFIEVFFCVAMIVIQVCVACDSARDQAQKGCQNCNLGQGSALAKAKGYPSHINNLYNMIRQGRYYYYII